MFKKPVAVSQDEWDKRIVYSPRELADALDIPLSKVADLCRSRQFIAFKIGYMYKIKRHEVIQYIMQSNPHK